MAALVIPALVAPIAIIYLYVAALFETALPRTGG